MTRAESLIASHWLGTVNSLIATFVALPVLAPMLLALGWGDLSDLIYRAYSHVCHQWAQRSFFILGPHLTYTLSELSVLVGNGTPEAMVGSNQIGYKIAFCERDLAIYSSILAAGLGIALLRPRIRPLSVASYAALLLPIAVDGFTQLFGWRESTPFLRIFTGTCFGAATVWFIYPRIDLLVAARSRGWDTTRALDG